MFFCHNWEISTKNLVTFKRWMGIRIKNFKIMGVHWKFLRGVGGSQKANIYGGLPKKAGDLDNLQIQEGDLRGG